MDALTRDVERIFYETHNREGDSQVPEQSGLHLRIRRWLDGAVVFGICFVLLPVILLAAAAVLWRNIRCFFSVRSEGTEGRYSCRKVRIGRMS